MCIFALSGTANALYYVQGKLINQEIIMSTKTCMQRIGKAMRRRPHVVPTYTMDPNNGYANCTECGELVYVGTGLHPNLGVPLTDAEEEARILDGVIK
jgi:hypothetical protein